MRASFSGPSSFFGSCFQWVNGQAYVLSQDSQMYALNQGTGAVE